MPYLIRRPISEIGRDTVPGKWSGNWYDIADETPDGFTTTIHCTRYEDRVAFICGISPIPPVTPKEVTVVLVMRAQEDHGTAGWPMLYINSTRYWGPRYYVPGHTWGTFSYTYTTNPATNAPWRSTDMSSITGIGVGGQSDGNNIKTYCTQIYLKIKYLNQPSQGYVL